LSTSHGHAPYPNQGRHVGLVVEKVALRQVFSEYFYFLADSAVILLTPSVTIGPIVAGVPSGLSPTHRKNKHEVLGRTILLLSFDYILST
jgi:hypothetical protein